MEHDFQYISKHDPKVKEAYEDLMQLLREVRAELRSEFTFQHEVVGSYARNMITYDAKGNKGYDFDVNIYPNTDEEDFTPKQIKTKFQAAIDRYCQKHGFNHAEDSTRVLTIKVKNRQHSRIEHSVDFAIVRDCWDEDGNKWQEFIHNDKKQRHYAWQRQTKGYHELPEKIQWLHDEGLWQEVREVYKDKKNRNADPHTHSRTIFANTVHEVCQRNGYYDNGENGQQETAPQMYNLVGFSYQKPNSWCCSRKTAKNSRQGFFFML